MLEVRKMEKDMWATNDKPNWFSIWKFTVCQELSKTTKLILLDSLLQEVCVATVPSDRVHFWRANESLCKQEMSNNAAVGFLEAALKGQFTNFKRNWQED